ncbi:hypothetical protein L0F63_007422 [Massospora cicadina]|nr:hypothetical protein L0F63_007422 [Massospora cicadina]
MMPSIQTLSRNSHWGPPGSQCLNPLPAPEHASTQPLAIDSSAAEMFRSEISILPRSIDTPLQRTLSMVLWPQLQCISVSGIKVKQFDGILADAELGARRASELVFPRESATASSIYGRGGIAQQGGGAPQTPEEFVFDPEVYNEKHLRDLP